MTPGCLPAELMFQNGVPVQHFILQGHGRYDRGLESGEVGVVAEELREEEDSHCDSTSLDPYLSSDIIRTLVFTMWALGLGKGQGLGEVGG